MDDAYFLMDPICQDSGALLVRVGGGRSLFGSTGTRRVVLRVRPEHALHAHRARFVEFEIKV